MFQYWLLLQKNILWKYKTHFFFITFILSVFTLKAQIIGKVVDAQDNYPLEYTSVAVYKTSKKTLVTGVVTNTKGFFIIEGVKPGNYYLEISFLGYKTKVINNIILKSKGESINLNTIKLILGSGNQLNEKVVKAEKNTILHKIDRQVFDTKKYQSTVGGNAIDALRNLPSVTIDGFGEISVRGSKGFTVIINGKPTQGDVSTILAQLPANALETVELITAPSAKYDPEGKGGILNIITKKGAIDGTFAQINVRGGFPSIEDYDTQVAAKRFGIDATINKRTGKWNLSFGASYQRNDKTGRREGDMFIINTPENKTPFYLLMVSVVLMKLPTMVVLMQTLHQVIKIPFQ